jgi:hypothetical protein
MASELKWQTKIIKRIRDEGGYARKWATQFAVGVPDLITIGAKPVGAMFIECKFEKDWNTKVTRTIAFTPKQKAEAVLINEWGVCFGLVVVHSPKLYPFPHAILFPVVIPLPDQTLRMTPLVGPGYSWKSTNEPLLQYLHNWRIENENPDN